MAAAWIIVLSSFGSVLSEKTLYAARKNTEDQSFANKTMHLKSLPLEFLCTDDQIMSNEPTAAVCVCVIVIAAVHTCAILKLTDK